MAVEGHWVDGCWRGLGWPTHCPSAPLEPVVSAHGRAAGSLCLCGCGELAPLALYDKHGYLRGEARRFMKGHNRRMD
jgi:hypothetical protein